MASEPKATLEIPSGLTAEQAHAIINAVLGALPPETPPEPIGEAGPELVGGRTGKVSEGRSWKSRKLWVALVSLVGMVAQLPLEKRLSPQELVAVACVAVAYLVMQGLVDIAKVRAR